MFPQEFMTSLLNASSTCMPLVSIHISSSFLASIYIGQLSYSATIEGCEGMVARNGAFSLVALQMWNTFPLEVLRGISCVLWASHCL